jgi:Sec-independent protein secretion pathway component TatC
MWEIGVSVLELSCIVGLCLGVLAVNKQFRGHAIGVAACFAVATVLTPADLLSTFCVGLLLTIAFVAGTLVSRQPQSA